MSIFNYPIKLVDSASYDSGTSPTQTTQYFNFARVENFLFGHDSLAPLNSTGFGWIYSPGPKSIDQAFSGSDFTPWPDISGVRTTQKSDLFFIKKENNEVRFYNFGSWTPVGGSSTNFNDLGGANPTAFKLFCEQENLYYDVNQPLNWNSIYRMEDIYEDLKTNNRTDLLLVDGDNTQARLNIREEDVSFRQGRATNFTLTKQTKESYIRRPIYGNWPSNQPAGAVNRYYFIRAIPVVEPNYQTKVVLELYKSIVNNSSYGNHECPDVTLTASIDFSEIYNPWSSYITRDEVKISLHHTQSLTEVWSAIDVCRGPYQQTGVDWWGNPTYSQPTSTHTTTNTTSTSVIRTKTDYFSIQDHNPNTPFSSLSSVLIPSSHSYSSTNGLYVNDKESLFFSPTSLSNLSPQTRNFTLLPATNCAVVSQYSQSVSYGLMSTTSRGYYWNDTNNSTWMNHAYLTVDGIRRGDGTTSNYDPNGYGSLTGNIQTTDGRVITGENWFSWVFPNTGETIFLYDYNRYLQL